MPILRSVARSVRAARLLPVLVLAGAALAGCGGAERGEEVLVVSAAASLRDAMEDAEDAFEAARPGVDVRLNLGGSGALRQQVELGADVDVFVSAAPAPMDALEAAGRLAPGTRRAVAGNRLVLVVPAGPDSTVRGWDDLARPGVRRIALGAPASVPAGAYAEEALRSLGLADAVAGRVVYARHVRQVLAWVEAGEADAGVVYETDAASSDRVRVAAEAPPGAHRPVLYEAAVVAGSERREAARVFVGWLAGEEGWALLRRRGFLPPPEGAP